MKSIPHLFLLISGLLSGIRAEVVVTGVNTNTDASYAADASATDLVNAGASSLASAPAYSSPLHFGPAENDGTVGTAGASGDISFWLSASAGQQYSITFPLDISVNSLGYDINSIQTIHGWVSNSGNQKNQNYVVEASRVGSAGFSNIATVAYLPFSAANTGGSTKVNITEDATGLLASGVDEIRFTYTIPASGGGQPSPTIREIDVFGVPTSGGPDTTPPVATALSPADNSVEVAPDSNLVITFNEAVTIGSGDITIKDLDTLSQTVIPAGDAQVSLSGTSLTINPNTDLDSNTNYAIQIAATTIDDLAGNSFAGIANDTTWNFTTENIDFGITSPVTRQVVQRNGSNLGSIPVAGTVGGPVDRVEARAVAPSNYDRNLGAIWFVGDSITQSNADSDGNGSPRKSLYDLLVADGASFSFTGHRTNNIDGLPASGGTNATNLYHFHSGVSGSMIGANTSGRTNMTSNIPDWWNSGRLASTRPNIALIMLGTNDINANDNIANAPNRIKTLVDTILAQVGPSDPTPAIFVAQITPNTGSSPRPQRVIDFNNALPAVVASLRAEGKDVTLVDQFSLINANTGGLMRDTLHTNAAGNDVLAGQWFEAIKARFAIPGGNTATTPWQTIATNPDGAFSGNLIEVESGGWYSVELRTIVDESPVDTATVDKIGVGDIYVTCGQSNSANFGSPAGTVADDRISAWDYSNGAWTKAADPMPGANGGGGSVWPRLGDLLAARDNVPIAFACLGVGSTRVNQWVPPGGNYPKIATAMSAFPAQGFRGVLWHQGESDSLDGTSTAIYQGRLESIIAQSRIDAGWAVPWFIAEVGFHPGSPLSREEPVVAAQRRAIFDDPFVYPGPVTDDFHLEAKLSDGVHFNGAGLADHAGQWAEVLGGAPPLAPKNGDLESNPSLADGEIGTITTTNNSSPSVIGWRALNASGEAVADGACGYFNPNDSFYLGSSDSGGNEGVLPGMSGKHVAFLFNSSEGANFLQTRRTMAKAKTTYTLTVALGVRNNPSNFGGARIEILANGVVSAAASFDKAALDFLRGSDASGTFTDAGISWTSGDAIEVNQPLAIRIVKEGGINTELDFDNVRFSATPTGNFNSWIDTFELDPSEQGFNDDPDGDQLANGIESWFGTNPNERTAGLAGISVTETTTTFTHPRNSMTPSDVDGSYQWSLDLDNWYESGSGPIGGPTVTFTSLTLANTSTVSAVSSDPMEQVYFRVVAVRN